MLIYGTRCEKCNPKLVVENLLISIIKYKKKLIHAIWKKLKYLSQEELAEKIYQVATEIINDEVKAKFRHPFRSKD